MSNGAGRDASILTHSSINYRISTGVRGGLERFKEAVDAYAAMLGDHMRKEEELLAQAAAYFEPDDWRKSPLRLMLTTIRCTATVPAKNWKALRSDRQFVAQQAAAGTQGRDDVTRLPPAWQES